MLNKGISKPIIIVIITIIIVLVGAVILLKKGGSGDKSKELEETGQIGGDCGTSESYISDYGYYDEIDFEEDSAMVCLGRSILSNCTEANALVKTDDYDAVFKVKGTSNSDCQLRFEYEDVDESFYIECPVAGLISYTPSLFKEDPSQYPGAYANAFFISVDFLMNTDDLQAMTDIGCVFVEQ